MTEKGRLSLWVWGVLASTLVFLLLNFAVWFFNLNLLFMPYPNCGDLARMALAPEISQCREEERNLSKQLQNPTLDRSSTFPILTFGDSISRGRGGGENNYWQDFVATRSGLDIAWVSEIDENNYTQDIVRLRNSGYLQSHKVRYLIVQAAERTAVNRFTKNVNWHETMPLDRLEARLSEQSAQLFLGHQYIEEWEAQSVVRQAPFSALTAKAMLTQLITMHSARLALALDNTYRWVAKYYMSPQEASEAEPVTNAIASIFSTDEAVSDLPRAARMSFLADGIRNQMPAAINNNYKWLQRKISNLIGADKYTEAAQRWKLRHPLFSAEYGDTLMFHLGDYKANRKNRDDSGIIEMHENLNRLSDFLARDGIRLFFMPTPNKLTIYQDYLEEPIETRSTFFPRLRSMEGKRYTFIDTEQVFSELVKIGERDLFFIDDTHWSNKTLPRIAELFQFP
ncbi:hypothetical protein J5J83_07865 [Azoarcus sp. L1K30]|uniref:alginate O-acetyltransferase AlgX-related protein n=1 Tax=Azoarcus sp. L1K30 TaxID=2820277 RepID=UPI001B822996|nr:hypothetical protein [Azoarcus sp. L1K30]MBR0566028.1 hypothetical protein [Azoarcus sp. L1K30]